MLCLEVLLDGRQMARAGGKDIAAIFVELSGGREGPIGFTVRGVQKDNNRHVIWVDEVIGATALVTFNILEDYISERNPPVLKEIKPIPAKRKELIMDVEINGQNQCKAQIGNFEFVGAWLDWNEAAGCFNFDVKSGICGENGYTAKKEWFSGKLCVGDSASVRVWSDIQQ